MMRLIAVLAFAIGLSAPAEGQSTASDGGDRPRDDIQTTRSRATDDYEIPLQQVTNMPLHAQKGYSSLQPMMMLPPGSKANQSDAHAQKAPARPTGQDMTGAQTPPATGGVAPTAQPPQGSSLQGGAWVGEPGSSGEGATNGEATAAAPAGGEGPLKPGMSKTFDNAARLGESMKSSLRGFEQAGELAGGAAASMGTLGIGGRSAAGRSELHQENPQTPQDLLVASVGGYGQVFQNLGLKAIRSPTGEAIILKSDGSPAPPGAAQELYKAIQAEPAALARYPGLFSKIPREHYDALKTLVVRQPQYSAFKDVGLTYGYRDIDWTRSCDTVAGDCNKAAHRSYKKNEFIAPDDLQDIWKAVDEDVAKHRADVAHAGTPNLELKAPGLLSRLGSFFTGGLAKGESGVSRDGGAGAVVYAGDPRGGAGPSAKPVSGGAAAAGGSPYRRNAASLPAPARAGSSSRALLAMTAAGAVTLAGAFLALRKLSS